MKALKPSHREKKRYLLIGGKDANSKTIDKEILRFIGILGYAKASPMIIKKIGKKIIMSVNRKEIDKIKASFAVSEKDLKIEKISGMINNLR